MSLKNDDFRALLNNSQKAEADASALAGRKIGEYKAPEPWPQQNPANQPRQGLPHTPMGMPPQPANPHRQGPPAQIGMPPYGNLPPPGSMYPPSGMHGMQQYHGQPPHANAAAAGMPPVFFPAPGPPLNTGPPQPGHHPGDPTSRLPGMPEHKSQIVISAPPSRGNAPEGAASELVWVAYRDPKDGAVYFHNRLVSSASIVF